MPPPKKGRTITDRFGHKIRVPEWPSSEGLAKLRRHMKRVHPRAFKEAQRKAARTRKKTARAKARKRRR